MTTEIISAPIAPLINNYTLKRAAQKMTLTVSSYGAFRLNKAHTLRVAEVNKGTICLNITGTKALLDPKSREIEKVETQLKICDNWGIKVKWLWVDYEKHKNGHTDHIDHRYYSLAIQRKVVKIRNRIAAMHKNVIWWGAGYSYYGHCSNLKIYQSPLWLGHENVILDPWFYHPKQYQIFQQLMDKHKEFKDDRIIPCISCNYLYDEKWHIHSNIISKKNEYRIATTREGYKAYHPNYSYELGKITRGCEAIIAYGYPFYKPRRILDFGQHLKELERGANESIT